MRIRADDSGLLANDYCAMDPRGSRVSSGAIFPESFPEGQNCTFHTAETVMTICVDCPVLKEDGSQTGLYHQAGQFCPEESKREICLPNFNREQVGTAVAGDAQWDFFNAFGYGTCTVHTEAPSTEPFNPFDPTDPNYPGTITDPNNPFIPVLPSNPGGYPVDPPVSPGNSTNPTDPPDPQDPLPPSDNMAG